MQFVFIDTSFFLKYAQPFPAVFMTEITSTEAICYFMFLAAFSTETQ